ncbi:MAG: class I SAM-dependent methyltransferase [Fimbriimonadaceae bacterium]|nr:class I SAM-dependent methyltransferase [Chitinophagales bacterium]
MKIISDQLEKYVDQHTSSESEHLYNLNRETNLKAMMPQMLSGHVQGKFLEFLSTMIEPKRILEIGTFTGYSGICLAKGLTGDGKIITIDINAELTPMVKKYVALENLQHKFDIRVGNALDIIPALDEVFDLVFIDADKINYTNYFDAVIDKVRTGGWILADNVLWDGKVIDAKKDKDTSAIDNYNKKIKADMRVENVIVSIRDGISIARKIG